MYTHTNIYTHTVYTCMRVCVYVCVCACVSGYNGFRLKNAQRSAICSVEIAGSLFHFGI